MSDDYEYDHAVTVHGALQAAIAREEAIARTRAEMLARVAGRPIGPAAPTQEDWQRVWDDLRTKLAPIWREIQRVCEAFFHNEREHIEQRQRITAAKNRARIVTRAKGSRRA